MARNTFKNFEAAQKAPFATRFGLLRDVEFIDHAIDNNYARKASNAADTADVEVYRVGPENNVRIATQVFKPDRTIKAFNAYANGDIADSVFFIADRKYTIHSIKEIHGVAGSVDAAVIVRRCESTESITAGDALCSSVDLTDTANTLVTATLSSNNRSDGTKLLELNEGDRLAVDFSGTLTTLADVTITVDLSPGHESETVDIYIPANGDLVDQNFYVATRPVKVVGIKQIHGTLGTNASAVSLQVEKCTGTTAAGSGTVLLTNNSNAGFNLKATINTVQEGALSATATDLLLAPGDRLALDFAGTLTAVAGLCVSVELEGIHDGKEVVYHLAKNASLGADDYFFTADRNYRVKRAKEVHGTAAGATLTLQLEICSSTTAAGSGTELLSNNGSTGFDLNATAATVQTASWDNEDDNYLLQGDRLALDFSTTVGSLVDLTVTVALEPI